jgi:ABC-type multidrug transport system ATPase subunit/predicted component of type VI protein secretion system
VNEYEIQFLSGTLTGQRLKIRREGLLLGRDESACQVVFPANESRLSRRHARLQVLPDGTVELSDLNSSNGTFVNQQRVQTAALQPGDVVDLGGAVRFTLARVESVSAPPASTNQGAGPPPVAGPGASAPRAPAGRREPEADDHPRLELIGEDGASRFYAISPQGIAVGRDPETCAVVLHHDSVSRVHARITLLPDHRVRLVDDSTNGTYVNRKRVQEAYLQNGDQIIFGLDSQHPLRLTREVPEAPDRRDLVFERVVTRIGRDPDNDIVVAHPAVSNHHARIDHQEGRSVLSDLHSTNGTFLNGRRVQEPTELQPGDQIQIGTTVITVGAEARAEARAGGLELAARELTQKAGGLTILDQVTLQIRGGEFVAILGPSGAGKTTLLNALDGFKPAVAGKVYLGGADLYRSFESLKSLIGFVPQDDIIHEDLTVYRALYYAARLRLSSELSDAEIDAIVLEVIDTLELRERRDTLVRRLSGGQRKRVNIGVELVTKPAVLFLDEPTSGLDPRTEALMMNLFRRLADSGTTVVCTTHLMSSLNLVDKLVLLVSGRLAFAGTAADAMRYFAVNQIDEIYYRLETKTPEEWKQSLQRSPYAVALPPRRAAEHKATQMRLEAQGRRSALAQAWILMRRYLEIKLNDRAYSTLLIVQAPFIGLTDALLFNGPNHPLMFFLIIFAALWFGCTNSLREIVGERSIYHRERQTFLRLVPYLASKVLVLSGFGAVQSFLILLTLYGAGRLDGPLGLSLGIVFLATWAGILMALVVSALVETTETSLALGVMVLFPQILFAGAITPLHGIQTEITIAVTAADVKRLGVEIPPGWGDQVVHQIPRRIDYRPGMSDLSRGISYVVVARWGLEAMADLYARQSKQQKEFTHNYLALDYPFPTALATVAGIGLLELLLLIGIMGWQDRRLHKS